ncbi:MAG: cation transporter [Saccharofermentanales bacterium]|jgi:copper chaperone CopZ
MKRSYKLQNLGCANCAAKIENDIAQLAGVNSVRVNFMTEKLILDADQEEFASILDQAQTIANKYEPDLLIIK